MAAAYLAAAGIDLDAEMEKIQFGPGASDPAFLTKTLQNPSYGYSPMSSTGPQILKRIVGVRLPHQPPESLWDVSVADGRISSIDPHDPRAPSLARLPGVLQAHERLLAPSLCHARVHLDRCFLLQDPKFSDLEIQAGDFDEAMLLTSKAKARFDEEDLLRRGRQLIQESIQSGVTAMRAFVEVGPDLMFKCLDAGIKLKQEFHARCDVQICSYAHLPLFSGDDDGELTRRLMAEAAAREEVDAVGSTPHAEPDMNSMRANVEWISDLALNRKKYLDLDLDDRLDEDREPLIWTVLDIIKSKNWTEQSGKAITLGPCTRLSLFSPEQWKKLKTNIGDLPISLIGLPTSDLFMMRSQSRARGMLPVLDLIENYDIGAAVSINNVGNAFTPHGTCDPLSLASLGVSLYQKGTKKSAEVLYECVSARAKASIGLEATSLSLSVGERADFVIFDEVNIGWRRRKTIAEVVYDAGHSRQTVFGGRLTS